MTMDFLTILCIHIIVPVSFFVIIPPPIIRQFQRFSQDDGSQVVDHDKGCNLAGNATAFIIMPDIIGI